MLCIKKYNTNMVWCYTIIMIIFITTGGDINATAPKIVDLLNITMIVLCIYPVLKYITNKHNIIIILGLSILWISVNFLVNYENLLSSILFIIKFITVASFVKYCNKKSIDLFNITYKLIVFIAIYSMVFYIAIQFLNINIPYKNIVVNEYEVHRSYLGVYMYNQVININGYRLIRNSSIFWEPGMYQVFLNFALFYILFMKESIDRKGKIILFILILSILSTTSTAGIILCLILIILKILTIQTNENSIKLFKLLLFIILIFCSTKLMSEILKNKKEWGSQSINYRINDAILPIQLFLKKPIFGWGFQNYSIYEKLRGISGGNSNGIMSLLYQLGIIGISFYTVIIIKSAKNLCIKWKENRTIKLLAYLSFIVISNMFQPIIFSNFMILILNTGLENISNK